MFEIDFKRLIALLLPMRLRRPVIFGLLRAGVEQVEHVYGRFMEARKGHIFRLTHNGQVCYLRAMLNEYFNTKGFRVESAKEGGEWLYAVAETGEGVPVAVDERTGRNMPVVYGEATLDLPQNVFLVYVPASMWARLDEVKEMVDCYKLVTKRAEYIKTSDPRSRNSATPNMSITE